MNKFCKAILGLVLAFGSVFASASNPILTLTANPTSGTAPLTVTFTTTCPTCVVYTWDFGDGQIATGPQQTHTYQTVGTFYPIVAASDKYGQSAVGTAVITSVSAVDSDNVYCGVGNVVLGSLSDGPALLPTTCVNSSLDNTPSPGAVVALAAGGNLQTAYNSLVCGQTLSLAHGATWQISNVTFGPKGCDSQHWITITSDGVLPASGTRISPSDLPQMATFFMKSGGTNAILTGDHIRFVGLAWTKQVGGKPLVDFVDPHGSKYIVFDRNYAHGNVGEETRRFISFNGANNLAVVDSWIDEMHCIAATGSCSDAQAIGGGNGTVPSNTFKIVNNYLSASAENILFGGGTSTITSCDIEIRGNYLYKPMSWNPLDPSFVPPNYVTKNLFELKNGCRVLFEGNVLQNTWGGYSQKGAAILITPKNQALNGLGVCPLCFVSDVVIRYNYISGAGQAFLIANVTDDAKFWSSGGHNYSIHDDLFDNLGYATCQGCAQNINQLGSGYISTNPPSAGEILHDVSLNHLTLVTVPTWPPVTKWTEYGLMSMDGPPAINATGTPQVSNITFENSILSVGTVGFYPTGGNADNCSTGGPTKNIPPAKMITNCWVGNSAFSGNVLVAYTGTLTFPAENLLSPSWTDLNFVNYSAGLGGDYHLSSGSAYKHLALDGTDPGANVDLVLQYTKNAVSGKP